MWYAGEPGQGFSGAFEEVEYVDDYAEALAKYEAAKSRPGARIWKLLMKLEVTIEEGNAGEDNPAKLQGG